MSSPFRSDSATCYLRGKDALGAPLAGLPLCHHALQIGDTVAPARLDNTFGVSAKYKNLKNVHCYNLALGSRPDKLVLQLRENSEHNTLVTGGAPDAFPSASQVVDVTTVDSLVASHQLSHLDILKMDVQAWEMEVMRGAANLIANQNVMFVFSEVAFRRDANEMQQFDELHSYLEHNGFLLCGFYDPVRYGPRKEFVFFANALYLNPEYRLKWIENQGEWLEWLTNQTVLSPRGK